MGGNPQNPPPNKYKGFSTSGMKSHEEFDQALSDLWAQGFTGEPVIVNAPSFSGEVGAQWVSVPGYSESDHK